MDEFDDSAYDEEEFPYPVKLTRESFAQNVEKYQVDGKILLDKFMYDNYRFITLDDLSSDLRSLLKELDDELINLINNDYDEFIKLGKSVEGSMELINNIKFDLNNYYNELNKSKQKLIESDTYLNNLKNYRNNLHSLKKICSNLILINNQFETFRRLLQENSTNIKRLIGLYLSIHKNLKITCLFLEKNGLDENNIEIVKNMINKSNLLRFEFKAFLEQALDSEEANTADYDKLSAIAFKRYLF